MVATTAHGSIGVVRKAYASKRTRLTQPRQRRAHLRSGLGDDGRRGGQSGGTDVRLMPAIAETATTPK